MTDPLEDLLNSGDEETPNDKGQDNESAAQARLDREKAKLKKQVEELTAWKAERETADRASAISNVFGEVGLNPKWSEFYQGEDATPDAIKAWAVDKGFIQVDEDAPEPEVETRGFTPTVVAESQVLGTKSYSFEEWKKVAETDEAKAMQLWNSGRVQPEVAPWAT